jgi:hypothetical protein
VRATDGPHQMPYPAEHRLLHLDPLLSPARKGLQGELQRGQLLIEGRQLALQRLYLLALGTDPVDDRLQLPGRRSSLCGRRLQQGSHGLTAPDMPSPRTSSPPCPVR